MFRPLPVRTFPAAEVCQAFRHLAQARHIGKVAVTFEPGEVPAVPLGRRTSIRPDASYLITGGLGGFGLSTAQWLTEAGARHLLLAGRSGASTEEARKTLETLRAKGVNVKIETVDISDPTQVETLIVRVKESMPPLAGVFHAAGVTADDLLIHMNPEQFERVMKPKMRGAWHLHTFTRHIPLDLFVLYSSAVSLLGNEGQANYSAANAFLDALAWRHTLEGLPALSVNWGVIDHIGMAARTPEVLAHLSRAGLRAMPPQQALKTL